MKFNKDSIKNLTKTIMGKITVACEKGTEVLKEHAVSLNKQVKAKLEGTPLQETRFDLHHFTTVCLIAVLAFFITFYSTGFNTTRVDAASMSAPVVGSYNEKALEVSYGDNSKIVALAKEILEDQVSTVIEPKKIAGDAMLSVYEIGDYVATVAVDTKLGETSATLSLETKRTYVSNDMKKIVTPTNTDNVEIVDGSTYTYNVKLAVVDTEAPKIDLFMDDTTIWETDDYSAEDYIRAVTDNVDGIITDYTIENEVPMDDDGTLEHGRHYVTIRAKDSSGNESEATLIVRVYKEDNETSSSSSSSSNVNKNNYQYASNGAVGSTIANAALAQVGRYQDCTMLVTNSLRAVGIYFHGWPHQYLSLGTIVPYSQAMPGDIVVYNGHVAIYIGNGLCVHGGWYGTNTAIFSIYIDQGAFTIVRV